MVNKVICIIPARKNSKRIKNKNIISFDGKPMIYWTIKAALNSKIFSKVIVSTDCEEIREISCQTGAEVPFLRNELADDFTPISLVTLSALSQAEEYWNEKFDIVVQMMPNCPNRDKNTVLNAFITGALWIAKVESLKKEKTFYGKKHKTYQLDWISAIDIDTKDDLDIAMIARKHRKEKNNAP